MQKRHFLILPVMAIALLVLLNSCKNTSRLHQSNINGTTQQTRTGSDSNASQPDTIRDLYFTSYTANFSCTIAGMNVDGQVRILHDSIIWISCTKIFEVARFRFTPNHVQGYSSLLNKYYDGDYATLAQRWGLDIDYATLQSLITGSRIPHCDQSNTPVVKGDSVMLQCTQQAGRYKRSVKMVKQLHHPKITSSVLTTAEIQQTITCRYGSYQTINTELTPSIINIGLKCRQGSYSTQLKFNRITLNKEQDYPLTIPKQAKKL